MQTDLFALLAPKRQGEVVTTSHVQESTGYYAGYPALEPVQSEGSEPKTDRESGRNLSFGGVSITPVSNDKNLRVTGRKFAPVALYEGKIEEIGKVPFFDVLKIDTLNVGAYTSERSPRLEEFEAWQESILLGPLTVHYAEGVLPRHDLKVCPGTRTHKYGLRNEFVSVHYEPRNYASQVSTCSFRFGAQFFFWYTKDDALEYVREMMSRLGYTYSRSIVQDLHVCCDVPKALPKRVQNRFRGTGIRGNAQWKANYKGRKITGYTKGGKAGANRFVLYDKKQEIQDARQTHYVNYLRWKEIDAEHISRFEMRLRREALNDNARIERVDSLESLTWDKIQRLWGYMTGHQFWISKQTHRVRADRADVLPFWKRVQKAAGNFVNHRVEFRPKVLKATPDANMTQGIGCITSALAKAGHDYASSLVHSAATTAAARTMKDGPLRCIDMIDQQLSADAEAAVYTFFQDSIEYLMKQLPHHADDILSISAGQGGLEALSARLRKRIIHDLREKAINHRAKYVPVLTHLPE